MDLTTVAVAMAIGLAVAGAVVAALERSAWGQTRAIRKARQVYDLARDMAASVVAAVEQDWGSGRLQEYAFALGQQAGPGELNARKKDAAVALLGAMLPVQASETLLSTVIEAAVRDAKPAPAGEG